MTHTRILEELTDIQDAYDMMKMERSAVDEAKRIVEAVKYMTEELEKYEDHACWAVYDIKKMLGVESEVSE